MRWILLSFLVGCDGLPGADWSESDCPGMEEYGERAFSRAPEVLAFTDGETRLADVQAAYAGYVGCGHFDPDDLRTLDRVEVRIDPALDLGRLSGTEYLSCEALDWVVIHVPVAVRVFGTRNQSLALRASLILDGGPPTLHVGAPCEVWAAPPCEVGEGGVSVAIQPGADTWQLRPPGRAAERSTTRVELGSCEEESP